MDIKDIEQYNRQLSKMDYAIFLNGKRLEADEEGFQKYKTISSNKNRNSSFKGGICWDYCVVEAEWFLKYFPDIPVEFYYHETIMDETTALSHTFLIFPFDDSWYWFEASWKLYAGLWKFKSKKEALLTVVSKLRRDAKDRYHKPIIEYYLSQYDPLNKKYTHQNVMGFMSLQRKNPQEIIPKKLHPAKLTSMKS